MDFTQIFSNPVVIWFLIGFVLLLLELAMPGLIIIFFGIGAWLTAFSCMLFTPDLSWQLFIFIITSVASLLLLRRWLLNIFFKKKDKEETLVDEFIGQKAIVETDINAGRGGKVIFKGAPWEAFSDVVIKAGEQVEIVSKESIKLNVRPLPKQ